MKILEGKKGTFIKVAFSLAIGIIFLYLAVRTWDWEGMKTTFLPRDPAKTTVGIMVAGEDPLPGQVEVLLSNGDTMEQPIPLSLTLTQARSAQPYLGELEGRIPHHLTPNARLAVYEAPFPAQQAAPVQSLDGKWTVRATSPPGAEHAPHPQGGQYVPLDSWFRLHDSTTAGSPEPDWAGPEDQAPSPTVASLQQSRFHLGGGPFAHITPPGEAAPATLSSLPASTITVTGMEFWWLAPYVLIFFLVQSVRVLRWGVLLSEFGKIRPLHLFKGGLIGFMAILLLPVRLGEFVRPWVVSRHSDIRMSSALATCVVERLVDGVFISLTLVLVLAVADFTNVPGFLMPTAIGAALAFTVLLILGVLVNRRGPALNRSIRRITGRFSKGSLATRISQALLSFINGLSCYPGHKKFIRFTGYTALYWLLNGLGYYVLFFCCGLQNTGSHQLLLAGGFAVMAVLGLGFIIPAGPGFIGNFEFFAGQGLALFLAPAIVATRGAVYVLLLHSLQLILQTLMALPFFFVVRETKGPDSDSNRNSRAPCPAPPAQAPAPDTGL